MDEQNDNQDPNNGVRLVGRREAEAAIQSGNAISRDTLAQRILEMRENSPVVIDEQQAVDIRDQASEETMSGNDYESSDPADELPESSNSSTLPHWTEPATGEVPSILRDMNEDDEPEAQAEENRWSFTSLGDASKLGEAHEEFDDDPFEVMTPSPFRTTIDEASRVTEPAPAEADPEFVAAAAAAAQAAVAARPSAHDITMEKVELLKKSSLTQRLGTGGGMTIIAIAAFASGPKWVLLMCFVALMLAATEYFDAIRRVGYRPATTLGLLAVAGAILGVYARGEGAIALTLVMATIFTFLWYLIGISKGSPMVNSAVTLMGVVWIGIFGSYSALMLREPNHHGVAYVLGGVLCVIAYDTAAYIGGTLIGKHIMAPAVSPGKTWEGLACATIASVVVGGLIVQAIHPWTVGGGLLLGLVVAVVAPIGDLAESMIKRDLGLKDMGRILPGHGGLLDRFDAMLLVLPATYYLVRMLHLA